MTFAGGNAFAQTSNPSPLDSSVDYQLQYDGDNTLDQSVQADVAVADATLVSVGAGTTRFDTTEGSLTVDNWLLGVSTNPYLPLSLSVAYDYWGRADEIELHTLKVNLGVVLGDWFVGITPQRRDIAVFLARREILGRTLPERVEMTRSGGELSITYNGFTPWWFGGNVAAYSYSRDLSRLETNPRLFEALFSPLSLSTVSFFEERGWGIELGRALASVDISANWDHSETVVAAGDYDVWSASVTWYAHADWSLRAVLGVVSPQLGEGVQYGGGGVTYYW